jgi:hypothetical protein
MASLKPVMRELRRRSVDPGGLALALSSTNDNSGAGWGGWQTAADASADADADVDDERVRSVSLITSHAFMCVLMHAQICRAAERHVYVHADRGQLSPARTPVSRPRVAARVSIALTRARTARSRADRQRRAGSSSTRSTPGTLSRTSCPRAPCSRAPSSCSRPSSAPRAWSRTSASLSVRAHARLACMRGLIPCNRAARAVPPPPSRDLPPGELVPQLPARP